MLEQKIEIDKIILTLCKKKQYEVYRNPRSHAGGKMVLSYDSVLNRRGRLEIDLNYLYRIPLWVPEWRYSADWPLKSRVRVLNIHELAAGKFHALLSRKTSRDLFDSYQLLTSWPLDSKKLRLAFTVYAGMRKDNWQKTEKIKVQHDVSDIRNKLFPVLQRSFIPGTKFHDIELWAGTLAQECQTALACLLPFNENERKFLSLLDEGCINPDLLSSDEDFCFAVSSHPALHWRIKQQQNTIKDA